ncbi:hypothetical protein [Arthrospira platensis]|uniref:Uncharacterized protein n=1 Tax=Limnospira platensis NIES-46 TaxID=1236695 RepID=A0A5M3TEP9_LIMPL|nr:hypothetical protein [Arthrospira platensis]AMW31091.1 hypothetical protein AP285_27405 [Arthrospira platensis YZ]KDR58596.1 hypothetical protein APPUASWS_004210 [Arthrospira platensis str. Paraca]MBD2669113.1 hypothetical protein [Arthrospira platensis FACHB-439]MBD2712360.1 hypothetical protein [Arthrospira platensis FACHB-835]MDF2208493.1 hypothetical protein [Arthrospira platensis NCB002]MDT9185339.1 hypothetical protein [Limnospira sp. PMC 289.06]MDT9297559.1 hypothetical protein [Ar
MKKYSLLRTLALALSFLISLALIINVSKPSDAIDSGYQNLIDLRTIYAVATPHELGLDQLGQQPVDLSTSPSLMSSINRVRRQLMQMPEDAKLLFPVGTNSPIRIGELQRDRGHQADSMSDEYEAVAYEDSSGNIQLLTAQDGVYMTTAEYNNRGNIASDLNSQNILVADASNTFVQARRYPNINLIVRNKRTGRFWKITNANLNAVCRDLLNAVLNRNLRRI